MDNKVKVLVVEDNAQTRLMLNKLLTRDVLLRDLNLEVIEAADGEAGLLAFKEHKPALVVSDLLMPKMDGFRMIELIRAHPSGQSVPIIASSAVVHDRKTLTSLENKFTVYVLPKPFSPSVFTRKVLAILQPPAAQTNIRLSEGKTAASPKKTAPPEPIAAAPLKREPSHISQLLPDESTLLQPPTPSSSPGASRQISGSLQEKGLSRLLIEFLEEQLSGSLVLRHSKVQKIIFLLKGAPIFVQSNLRGETLGQLLIRRGIISVEQHTKIFAESSLQKVKYGEMLVRLGLMTEGQVMNELLSQTKMKIEACLEWHEGDYNFVEDNDVGSKVPRCTVDPIELVIEHLTRRPNVEEAFARFAGKEKFHVTLLPRFEKYRDKFLAAYGAALTKALIPNRNLGLIMQATGNPQQAVMQLDALEQMGMIELHPPSNKEITPPPILESQVRKKHDSIPLQAIVLPPSPSAPAEIAPADSWEDNSQIIRLPEASPKITSTRQQLVERERREVALQLIQSTYLGLHDATYFQILGVAPRTDPASIEVAYEIKRKQFAAEKFAGIDLGEHAGHLEEIVRALDLAYQTLSDSLKRFTYEQSLKPENNRDAEHEKRVRAEFICHQGEEQLAQEKYAEAAKSFAEAVQLDEQAEYMAKQAYASFLANQHRPDVAEEAMVLVQLALAIDGAEQTAHLAAAKISRALGHLDEAVRHYEKLIKLDPHNHEAFNELEGLLLEQNNIEMLELEYRRTLHFLQSENPEWTAELWKRLTLLYRDKIQDPERMRTACQAALRLLPNDRELSEFLAQLDSSTPGKWPAAVDQFRTLLLNEPQEADPLHQIFRLHHDAHRKDSAFLAASAAKLRQVLQPDEQQFIEEVRPPAFKRTTQPLTPELFELLRHPLDDQPLANLFRLLAPSIHRLNPISLEQLGVQDLDLVMLNELPPTFGAMLRYVMLVLGREMPQIALKEDLALEIKPVCTHAPGTLLVGQAALEHTNHSELVFLISRAMTLLMPAYEVTSYHPRRLLRRFILGALSITFPQAGVPDPDGEVSRIREDFEKYPDLNAEIKAATLALKDTFRNFNINEWQHSLWYTANRVGLLLCGDLAIAGKIVAAQDSAAEIDLVDFALSEIFTLLRTRLGLAL